MGNRKRFLLVYFLPFFVTYSSGVCYSLNNSDSRGIPCIALLEQQSPLDQHVYMSGFNNFMQSVCSNSGPSWILMLWFPLYVEAKTLGEIPVLQRKAGAGKVPPIAGRKLQSGEWCNKKSNTGMEELIGLVWPLEVRMRTWDWIAKDWVCIKPPLQSWNPVDSLDWLLKVALWS